MGTEPQTRRSVVGKKASDTADKIAEWIHPGFAVPHLDEAESELHITSVLIAAADALEQAKTELKQLRERIRCWATSKSNPYHVEALRLLDPPSPDTEEQTDG